MVVAVMTPIAEHPSDGDDADGDDDNSVRSGWAAASDDDDDDDAEEETDSLYETSSAGPWMSCSPCDLKDVAGECDHGVADGFPASPNEGSGRRGLALGEEVNEDQDEDEEEDETAKGGGSLASGSSSRRRRKKKQQERGSTSTVDDGGGGGGDGFTDVVSVGDLFASVVSQAMGSTHSGAGSGLSRRGSIRGVGGAGGDGRDDDDEDDTASAFGFGGSGSSSSSSSRSGQSGGVVGRATALVGLSVASAFLDGAHRRTGAGVVVVAQDASVAAGARACVVADVEVVTGVAALVVVAVVASGVPVVDRPLQPKPQQQQQQQQQRGGGGVGRFVGGVRRGLLLLPGEEEEDEEDEADEVDEVEGAAVLRMTRLLAHEWDDFPVEVDPLVPLVATHDGSTALHLAAGRGNFALVNRFLAELRSASRVEEGARSSSSSSGGGGGGCGRGAGNGAAVGGGRRHRRRRRRRLRCGIGRGVNGEDSESVGGGGGGGGDNDEEQSEYNSTYRNLMQSMINVVNKHGASPLHWAAQGGHRDVVGRYVSERNSEPTS